MPGVELAKAPGRGRPPMELQRHVIQDLMTAAEAALANKTSKETTVREIAEAAGINKAMIQYYFGGKGGLIMALFLDFVRNHPNSYAEEIADACTSQRTIRPLVERLIKFYNSRPNLSRMTMSEVINGSSKIKELYDEGYSLNTPTTIAFVLKSLMDTGIYRQNLNVKFATISIMSMIVAPPFLWPVARALDLGDSFDSSEWIDHIVRTIDMSMKSSGH